ncbi:MAG: hypothetical protein D6692_14750 [Planctomycetota bacterium]|nr:MAG: hypothetical protein D6692_14750 [Planctomycetota bacterium]
MVEGRMPVRIAIRWATTTSSHTRSRTGTLWKSLAASHIAASCICSFVHRGDAAAPPVLPALVAAGTGAAAPPSPASAALLCWPFEAGGEYVCAVAAAASNLRARKNRIRAFTITLMTKAATNHSNPSAPCTSAVTDTSVTLGPR